MRTITYRNKASILKYFMILFFYCVSPNYGKVVSWSINNIPSLILTDKTGVIESNNAIMADSTYTNNRIRIEDIVLEQGYSFTKIFIRFQKKNFSSFVRLKVYDTFTDTEVLSFDLKEQDTYVLTNDQLALSRIYFVIELYGNDIELRSAGMEMVRRDIITEDALILNTHELHADRDNLEITMTLQESAKITLLVYNREGDISKSFLVNKVLNNGTYKFYMDPQELSFDYLGDKRYYIWLRAENFRSDPVEFIKSFNIIP